MQFSCSFREYLELCLENKGLEQIPGMDNIPDNIKMIHLKAVWNSAIQLSDDFYNWGAVFKAPDTGTACSKKSEQVELVRCKVKNLYSKQFLHAEKDAISYSYMCDI